MNDFGKVELAFEHGGDAGPPELLVVRHDRHRTQGCHSRSIEVVHLAHTPEKLPHGHTSRRSHASPHFRVSYRKARSAFGPSSVERRVGRECVRKCRSRWCPDNYKKTI